MFALPMAGQVGAGMLLTVSKSGMMREHGRGLYSDALHCQPNFVDASCGLTSQSPLQECAIDRTADFDNWCGDAYQYMYDYPWTVTLITFVGKGLCLLLHLRNQRRSRTLAIAPDSPSQPSGVMTWRVMALIAVLELLGSGCGAMGLAAGVSVSVYCLLKGCKPIFVAAARCAVDSPVMGSVRLEWSQFG